MDNNKPDNTETKRIDLEELRNSGKLPPYNTESTPVIDSEYEEYEDDNIEETPLITRSRRRSTGLVGGIMYFALVIGISAILACLLWIAANDVLALNKTYHEATIQIPELPYNKNDLIAKLKEQDITAPANATVDELLELFETKPTAPVDMDALVQQLKDNGLIEYPQLFKLYAGFANASQKIEPGTYELNTDLDYNALVKAMRKASGARPIVEDLTIPEGYTVAQIFALLEEQNICSVEDLQDAASNFDFEYDFLEGLPLGDPNRLEGFLFPDTYDFFQSSDADEAIKKFLNNFRVKFDSGLVTQTTQQGRTIKEVLTIASLIEREAADDSERPTIASVIFNRLNNWDSPLLQIDASVMYALGAHKDVLTSADLEVDSPYNLYKYTGLPPGPIANPGIASIKAALNPDTSNYYYYALDKTNKHRFFKTYEEHTAFVASDEFVNN